MAEQRSAGARDAFSAKGVVPPSADDPGPKSRQGTGPVLAIVVRRAVRRRARGRNDAGARQGGRWGLYRLISVREFDVLVGFGVRLDLQDRPFQGCL